MRIPVHQPLAAVDVALAVHLHEDADHRVVEVAVFARRRAGGARHGEGLAAPVAGGAEALELVLDVVGGADLLLPDSLDEPLAPHLAPAGLAVLRQLALDDHLCRNACVVGAGLPERVEAAHPVPARQDVLQRVVEGVAHVERAGDVGRRDHDAEGVLVRGVGAGAERARLLPGGVDARFGFLRVEGLFHRHERLPGPERG